MKHLLYQFLMGGWLFLVRNTYAEKRNLKAYLELLEGEGLELPSS